MRWVIQEWDHDPEYPGMMWVDVMCFALGYVAERYLAELREAEPDMTLRLVERMTVDRDTGK